MNQADLHRVREDLATIQHAVRLELPFSKEDIRTHLWSAACGAFITLWAAFGPWNYRWIVLIPISVAIVMTIRSEIEARRQRSRLPSAWREHQLSGKAALVAVPAAIGYMYWEHWTGMPRGLAGAASMFFFGVGALVFAVLDRRRLYYAGGAIPLMAFGFAMPHCSPQQVILAAGLCWTVGGLMVAALQTWQLQVESVEHGAD